MMYKIPYQVKDLLSLILCISALAPFATAEQNWSRWMGPNQNFLNKAELPALSELSVDWKGALGFGYSGVVIQDEKVISLGHDGKNSESVRCLNQTGKELWKYSYKAELMDKMHVGGPNSTPLIADERVYSISKDGQVFCFELETGKMIWKVFLPSILKTEAPIFGYASSPILHKGQLIISAGEAIALNASTGQVNWVTNTADKASYASPLCFESKGQDYALIMTGIGVRVISLKQGKLISEFKMKTIKSSCVSPIKVPGKDNEFFVATNVTSSVVRFENGKLTPLWSTSELRNKLTNSLLIDDHIYGIDGSPSSRRCKLVCLEMNSGKVKWTQPYEHGTLLGFKNTICYLSDEGELVQFEINPLKYIEKGRKQVLTETCWTVPSYANGKMFLRNDLGELLCLKVQ